MAESPLRGFETRPPAPLGTVLREDYERLLTDLATSETARRHVIEDCEKAEAQRDEALAALREGMAMLDMAPARNEREQRLHGLLLAALSNQEKP